MANIIKPKIETIRKAEDANSEDWYYDAHAVVYKAIVDRNLEAVQNAVKNIVYDGGTMPNLEAYILVAATSSDLPTMMTLLSLIPYHNDHEQAFILPVNEILLATKSNYMDSGVRDLFLPFKDKVLYFDVTFIGIFEEPKGDYGETLPEFLGKRFRSDDYGIVMNEFIGYPVHVFEVNMDGDELIERVTDSKELYPDDYLQRVKEIIDDFKKREAEAQVSDE